MYFATNLFHTAAFLLFCATLVNSRSLDLTSTSSKDDTSASKQIEPGSHDTSWLPSSTHETQKNYQNSEFYRCHGAPCDEWERTRKKVKMLKVIAAEEAEKGAEKGEESVVEGEELKKVMDSIDSEAERLHVDNSDLLDGCIWLTESQADEMLQSKGVTNEMLGEEHVMKKRTVDLSVASGSAKWDMPIAVTFDGKHPSNELAIIKAAMSHIEERTCVRFNILESGDSFPENAIWVTRESTGCHSYVGRTGYTLQQVNLQSACLFNFGTPVHEFLHALGMWHEMQRSDRDDFINMMWNNIGAYRGQFYKRGTDNTVPYDTSSVLHYTARDGSTRYDKNSMETKNPLYQQNMGQRVEMSFLDAMSINSVYCQDTCKGISLPRPCLRGGYQHPNDCNRCLCPPGFGGRYCEELASSNRDCGGLIELDNSNAEVYIESPGYSQSEAYDLGTECNWQFKVAPGSQVSLEFVGKFRLYCSYHNQCFHWVEVQYEEGKNTQGPRFCCRDAPDQVITSESNEMTVLLRANYDATAYHRTGFRARVKLVPGDNQGEPEVPRTTTTSTTTTRRTTTTSTTTTTTQRPTTTTSTTTTTPRPTNRPGNDDCTKVDLTITLDSSGSVGQSNWTKLRQFTKNVLSHLHPSSACARISLISIGTHGYIESYLNENYDDINAVINDMRWRTEWTNTASALEKMRTEVYTTARGDRSDVKNVAVVVMDGPSNRDQHLTIPNAEAARNLKDVQFIVIGVSNKASISVARSELEAIAGNDRTLFLMDGGFDDLNQRGFPQDIAELIKDLASGKETERQTTKRPTTTTTQRPTTTTTQPPTTTTKQPTTTKPTTTTNAPGVAGMDSEFICNFENEAGQATWCGISQSGGSTDQFDWTITNKATPSEETGAERAHSGNYFIFIEASSPRSNQDSATIELPQVSRSSAYCLSFAYHMYGHHIDTLFVNKVSSNGWRSEMWSESGQKGNHWRFTRFEVRLNANDRIAFTARRGKAFSGDIGLDTIKLKLGEC